MAAAKPRCYAARRGGGAWLRRTCLPSGSGKDLFGEEVEAGAVVGDLGEVEDRVAHAQPADLLEALGDLFRGAHEEAVGHAAGAVFGDVLGDAILQNWNNFLFPLVLTNSEHLMISQGLTVFQGQLTGTAYNLLMAGSLIAVVPVLIMAMFAQRKVVGGLTLGAIR
jgi:hypothetical protein